MRFEWDPAKGARNRVKHGIGFETAQLVFDDPHAISALDRVVEGEDRWKTVGMVGGKILIVAHALRTYGEEEDVRIISARLATARERRLYAEAH